MKNKINEFIKKVKLKEINDKLISEDDSPHAWEDFRERVYFTLSVDEHTPALFQTNFHGGRSGTDLILLDTEDIKYFYDKYSKFAQDELNEKIESLKKEYNT